MRLRIAATWCLGLLLAGLPILPASAKGPPSPRNARATVAVGGIWVSWSPLATSGTTYQVTSSPAGKSCSVVDADRCFVPVTDSTPWRFQVAASNASGTSKPSALTRPYRQRMLLIVAGQSNALGASSLALDPATKVNYLQRPYANGADTASSITWVHQDIFPMPASHPVKLSTPQVFTPPGGTPAAIFGPELALARQLYADHHLAVTVVKATWGSADLAEAWSGSRLGSFSWRLINHTNALMEADAAAGQLDVLGMAYWHQGEADSTRPAWAATYQDNLVALVGQMRSFIHAAGGLRFTLVKVWTEPWISLMEFFGADPGLVASYRSGLAAVRAADDWAAANLSGVATVDSADLSFSPIDPAHLSNQGELALGQRLATASWPLLP